MLPQGLDSLECNPAEGELYPEVEELSGLADRSDRLSPGVVGSLEFTLGLCLRAEVGIVKK